MPLALLYNRKADEVLDDLEATERALCETMDKGLVGTPYTRRQIPVQLLIMVK